MAQDLWSKPDDNNNNLGAGWDGSQLMQQNNGGYPGNGWQPGNNYSQNSYQQNGWQPQNGYGYPNAAPPVEQNDVFGQSGKPLDLLREYELTGPQIAEKILKNL